MRRRSAAGGCASPTASLAAPNSVLPHGPAAPDVEAAVARVEAAYAERGLDPRFLISPAASPPKLDAILAEHGYAAEAATLVQTVRLPLPSIAVAKGVEANVAGFDEAWLSAYAAAEELTPREVEGRRAIHRRIRVEAGYATARVDGHPVGVGSVVVEDGWAGVHNMATATEHRRRGLYEPSGYATDYRYWYRAKRRP